MFAFFISGAKERNPAAAMALQAKLGISPPAETDAPVAGKAKPPQLKTAAPKAAKTPAAKAAAKKAAAKKK